LSWEKNVLNFDREREKCYSLRGGFMGGDMGDVSPPTSKFDREKRKKDRKKEKRKERIFHHFIRKKLISPPK
jgi:hypothetical protein